MNTEQIKATTHQGEAVRSGPSPEKFFETITAYQRTAVLKAAIDLDLFTAIGEGQKTVPLLAKRIDSTERSVRILCDALVAIGFLTKAGDRYGLTADTAVFLDKKSPAYVGSATLFMASPAVTGAFTDLATVARSGRPQQLFTEVEHPAWVDFASSMAPLSYLAAQETAKLLGKGSPMKVLDIAAGHGMYGIAVAQQNPKAKVVALDWPTVLAVAQENARRAGIADRYILLPGDALEIGFGSGFDAVLVPNLLHHWDRPTNERFLQKVYNALGAGGRVVIVEFTPNEDHVSPTIPALFALNMLALTAGGDAYSVKEHLTMLSAAGFSHCEIQALLPTPLTAIVAMKS